MYMDEGMDTGDMLVSERIKIEDNDNIEILSDKLSVLGSKMIVNYLEDIIYNYLTNHELNIDRKKIIKFALQVNNYNYRVFPLVMYIILEYYNSYFKKEDTSELL